MVAGGAGEPRTLEGGIWRGGPAIYKYGATVPQVFSQKGNCVKGCDP